MANIVLGLGTPHSPQMSTPPELWSLHAERDRTMERLHFRGGYHTFDELEQLRRDEHLDRELTQDVWNSKHAAIQRAAEQLRGTFLAASPDLVVIVANDHKELLLGNLPALAVYWADYVEAIPQDPSTVPPSIRPALWARQADAIERYPCDVGLGRHLIEQLTNDGFDVAELSQQPAGRSIGHGFTHVRRRIMVELVPIVPVLINSYYPPNQPTAARCYDLGRALGRAITSWDSDQRVCVIASGGLSHFVVDADFDLTILQAMQDKDSATLRNIGQDRLMDGTAETRHWIATAGALEDLRMEIIEYIPAYRTRAGTGCGMAFTCWIGDGSSMQPASHNEEER